MAQIPLRSRGCGRGRNHRGKDGSDGNQQRLPQRSDLCWLMLAMHRVIGDDRMLVGLHAYTCLSPGMAG